MVQTILGDSGLILKTEKTEPVIQKQSIHQKIKMSRISTSFSFAYNVTLAFMFKGKCSHRGRKEGGKEKEKSKQRHVLQGALSLYNPQGSL